jgi:hypothetical protein
MKKEDKDFLLFEHSLKMKEIEERKKSELELENLKFSHQLELQRIKSAEIKRTIQRKKDRDFMESYSR